MKTRLLGAAGAVLLIGGLVTLAAQGGPQAPAGVPTATVLTISPNPSSAGEEVAITARVNLVNPSPDGPSGTVEFFDLETSLGTATLSDERVATLKLTSLSGGPHPITAKYLGDTRCAGSLSAVVSHLVTGQ
jgi:Bacterial Ig-like domain (group 3)